MIRLGSKILTKSLIQCMSCLFTQPWMFYSLKSSIATKKISRQKSVRISSNKLNVNQDSQSKFDSDRHDSSVTAFYITCLKFQTSSGTPSKCLSKSLSDLNTVSRWVHTARSSRLDFGNTANCPQDLFAFNVLCSLIVNEGVISQCVIVIQLILFFTNDKFKKKVSNRAWIERSIFR